MLIRSCQRSIAEAFFSGKPFRLDRSDLGLNPEACCSKWVTFWGWIFDSVKGGGSGTICSFGAWAV
jgi:hypothetical protein